jgi:hypothetical protein
LSKRKVYQTQKTLSVLDGKNVWIMKKRLHRTLSRRKAGTPILTATRATIVAMASPHVCFTLCITNMHELEECYRGCNASVVAAYKLLAGAIMDLEKATEAVKAADAKEAKIWQDGARVTTMLARHRTVAKEYTTDALKIQHQGKTQQGCQARKARMTAPAHATRGPRRADPGPPVINRAQGP